MADIFIQLDAKADASAKKIAKEMTRVIKAFPRVRFRMDASEDNVVILKGRID